MLPNVAQALGPWEPCRERALRALDDNATQCVGAAQATLIGLLLVEGQARRALELDNTR